MIHGNNSQIFEFRGVDKDIDFKKYVHTSESSSKVTYFAYVCGVPFSYNIPPLGRERLIIILELYLKN